MGWMIAMMSAFGWHRVKSIENPHVSQSSGGTLARTFTIPMEVPRGRLPLRMHLRASSNQAGDIQTPISILNTLTFLPMT